LYLFKFLQVYRSKYLEANFFVKRGVPITWHLNVYFALTSDLTYFTLTRCVARQWHSERPCIMQCHS